MKWPFTGKKKRLRLVLATRHREVLARVWHMDEVMVTEIITSTGLLAALERAHLVIASEEDLVDVGLLPARAVEIAAGSGVPFARPEDFLAESDRYLAEARVFRGDVKALLPRCVAFTSLDSGGVGKTTLTLNLALAVVRRTTMPVLGVELTRAASGLLPILAARDAEGPFPTTYDILTAWEEGVRMARFLERVVRERAATVLISGAFSTGKTTLLNALMAFLPPEAMVAVAESFREVRLPHAGCVRAVVPHFAGDDPDRLTLDEAVNAVLTRTRPDVIVLGEIVSEGEAREFLRAANLGVRGLATIHGNDARGALNRLADLATRRETPLEAVRRMAAAAVDLVVHMARQGSRRYAAEIARVRGVDGKGEFVLDILYRAGEGHEEMLDRLLGEVRP